MSSSLGLCASSSRDVGLDFRGISRIITNIRRHRLIPELQDRFCGSRSNDVQYQHRCSHEVSQPSAGALKPHALLEFREANATLYSQPLRITHASHCACIRSVNLAQQGSDFPASPACTRTVRGHAQQLRLHGVLLRPSETCVRFRT